MSESQSQQTTKTSNILPWLRFWCNLIFCVLFLTSFIIAGCHLIKNTKPQGSKNIIKLIETIKENAKTVMIQHQAKDKPKVAQQPKDIPSSNSDSLETDKLPSNNIGNITVESSKTDEYSECYTIRLDDFENALKAVALASHQEAAEDYHKSFSILVTILTIFGIGFPVIIALIQHSFNERDLDKIDGLTDKAKDATNKAEDATNKAEDATNKADDATNKANTAINQANGAYFGAFLCISEANAAKQKAQDAVKQANKSLDENIEMRKSIGETQHNIFQQIGFIYYQLSEHCTQLIENEEITYYIKSKLYNIKAAEIYLKNKSSDNSIRELIHDCNSDVDEIIQKLNKLSIIDVNAGNVIKIILKDLNEYHNVLMNIRNNLSKDFENDINILQKNVSNVINVVNEKEEAFKHIND